MSEQEAREDVPPTSEEEESQAAELDWDENEPSPHQGEQGQESE
jgi:hypothetical protein